MVQVEDKDYLIHIVRLIIGVIVGFFVFYMSDYLLTKVFEVIDNILFNGKGKFSLIQQIIYWGVFLVFSAVGTFTAVVISTHYKKIAAQITSTSIGLYFGMILWFLGFSLTLIIIALIVNYFVAIQVARMAPGITEKMGNMLDSSKND